MDGVAIGQGIVSLLNIGALLAIYLYIQRREDKMREDHRNDMNALEEKVKCVDAENDEIRKNYTTRLDAIKDSVSAILIAIARIETKIEKAS